MIPSDIKTGTERDNDNFQRQIAKGGVFGEID